MLKKQITYTNIDGESVTEEFYFNMTKAELLKLELSENEGFQARIERIQQPGIPGRVVLDTFDGILRQAYGVRTADGKFIKPVTAFQEFSASEAYSELLFELVTDANKTAQFINGIMPQNIVEEVEREASQRRAVQDNVANIFESKPYEVSVHSEANPNNMTDEELLRSLGVEEEQNRTAGLTDDEIKAMSGRQLAAQPREVLLRAHWLKQNS